MTSLTEHRKVRELCGKHKAAAKLDLIGLKIRFENNVVNEKNYKCLRITEHQSPEKAAHFLGVTDWRTKNFWGIPWNHEWQSFDDAFNYVVDLLKVKQI